MRAAALTSQQLLDRRQFFQIDALDPFLQFLRILVLQLDLEKITIGDHYPKRGVSILLFERFEAGIAIDSD